MSIITNTFFKNYFTDFNNDELLNSKMEINPNWKTLVDNLHNIGTNGLVERQKDVNWLLSENGVTYNVYNDPKGLNRPWNLNIIPFIVHENEWELIEKGLKQRVEVLNLILKDIYGKKALIKNGILPYEVIYGHRGFLRQCDQIQYNTEKHLLIHAADIARGPDGRMWVVNDRSQAPSGMGYALENRSTSGRVLSDMFNGIHIKRLSSFFQNFNQLLIDSSPKNKENPHIVVLTPGPHNETYFEHAYLSSFLGYPLVQGNDLIVRDGFLWMKSLKGLKQVDVVLRRVDDVFSDPLELREDSHLGVAGLLEVVRQKNVSIINPIGSGVIENPGLIPFMSSICKYFLNEELILPQIATWWCGQEKEKNYVLENLSKLVIKRIDRSNRESIFFGDNLTNEELVELKKRINDRPYRFVAQDKIKFSTAPNFDNYTFEPRNLVCRTFTLAKKQEYTVMPGGLVRVAPERDNFIVSNQRGGTSKDFWITSNQPDFNTLYTWNRKSAVSTSGLNDLPSLTAENLFWAGRYVGRTLITARFIRMVLKQMSYVNFNEKKPNSASLEILFQAVTHLTDTFPGFIGKANEKAMNDPYTEILSVILDKSREGSLAHTISMFSNSYYSIRNLWSTDMWRVFDDIQKMWANLEEESDLSINRLIQVLNKLITRLIAFMGLIEESILVDQGLLLYFIGLQLEQSILNICKSRALLTVKQNEQTEYEILESLLNSHESLNIYRYSYRSFITIENVIDLTLLDLKYSRSLAYRLNRLNKDISKLPNAKLTEELTEYQKYIFEAFTKLRLVKSERLIEIAEGNYIREELDKLLSELSDLLHKTSLSITNNYFSHTYEQNQLVTQNFPI